MCLNRNPKYDVEQSMKKVPEEIASKLLQATEKMPEGSGFDVSIDEVALMSGVPRATLYYYFSGREDLVQFYLNNLIGRTATAVEKAAAGEGSAPERLAEIMRSVAGAFAEYPRMCVEMASAFKASPNHAEFLGNVDRAVMTPLRETLRDGVAASELVVDDIEMTAAALMGALHQASLSRLIFTGKLDAQEVGDVLVPLLMNGMTPR